VGADQPSRRLEVGAGALIPEHDPPDAQGRLQLNEPAPLLPAPDTETEATRPEGRVVRVIPDVPAIDREFDYLVPSS
jgi:hypothetical protein